MDVPSSGIWKVIPSEELAGFKRGAPVVVCLERWRKGRKEFIVKPGIFEEYSPARGIVLISFEFNITSNVTSLSPPYWVDGEFCDNTVGRYETPEPCELHLDNSGYDE